MIVKQQKFTFGQSLDDMLSLRCGKEFGPVDVAYETYGELNADKSNAILICHALTGDCHAAGRYSPDDKKAGWWDSMIGPGKAFDTDKYYVVSSNILGSCYGTTGPSSINPATGEPYNHDFPMVTIADMVNVQFRLMQYLTIDKWLLVAGGSLGGMQVLQWAVSYPDRLHACMPIATTTTLSPQSIAFDWVGREAIMADKNFNEGNYTKENLPDKGVSIARMLAHITYLSDESMHMKFGRRLQEMTSYNFEFSHNFQVESYLRYQGAQFVNRFDANTYLYITRAMDYFDLAYEADGNGELKDALAKAVCQFLIVSFSSDWLFPPYQSQELVKGLQANNKPVSYCEIESSYGHDAFLLEFEQLGEIVKNYLHYSSQSYEPRKELT